MSSLKELEKRVSELENKIGKLTVKRVDTKTIIKSKNNLSSEKKTKKKRKPNKFIIMMSEARKQKKESFEYNGNMYKGVPHDKFGMVYKKIQ
jgi:hypothetical protein